MADSGPEFMSNDCFFSGAATAFVDELRADGHAVDVSMGVVGPSSLPLRQRMAARCDVTPPTSPYVTPFMRRLAAWQAACGSTADVQAVHLYPFGGLESTLKWLRDFADDAEFTDAMPLDPLRRWTERLAVHVPVWEVDSSCTVPMHALPQAPERAFSFRDATRARRPPVAWPWRATKLLSPDLRILVPTKHVWQSQP